MHFILIPLLLSFAVVSQALPPPPAELKPGERLPATANTQSTPIPPAISGYRELKWDDLIPNDWNPEKELGDINWDELDDADPRAEEALKRMRAVWDSAPAEKSLDGTKVKLAGFVVPLEYKGDEIREFLLVPYFGACIHAPPPPANQIVYVISAKLPANFQTMDPFWVNGTMKIDHSVTDMGFSSYQMVADSIEPFILPANSP